MTAIAAHWMIGRDHADASACSSMLAAQARYGSGPGSTGVIDGAVMAIAPHPLTMRFSDRVEYARGGDLAIVADLRLDARDELAAVLRLPRHSLVELSDAGLLTIAWERWGSDALQRIVGGFALIAYDHSARTLSLARDVNGEFPLFWTSDGRRVAVASMTAGLRVLPQVGSEPDVDSAVAALGLLAGPGGASFYRGISKVRPGELVTISADGVRTARVAERAVRELRLRRLEDYQDAYREQLDRAVEARLRGGSGSIASHLSGGWDSSAVTGTAARLLQPVRGRITAFTSVPRATGQGTDPAGRFVDETAHARAAAAMFLNVEHVVLPTIPRSPLADFDRRIDLYGRPLSNPCNHVWLDQIRACACDRGLTVMLTGQAGNFTITSSPVRLLSDYIRRGALRDWWQEAVAAVLTRRARLRGVLAASFWPWLPHLVRDGLLILSSRPADDSLFLLTREFRDRISVIRRAQEDRIAALATPHATALAMADLDPGDLRKGMLAGWNMQERDPTEDIRLTEFMLSLPPEMFLHRGVRRPLAHAALADRVPPMILDERRKGHQATDWHEGLTADRETMLALMDRIASHPLASSLIDVPAMRRLASDWPSGDWERPAIYSRYRRGLLNTLSVGHFLVTA